MKPNLTDDSLNEKVILTAKYLIQAYHKAFKDNPVVLQDLFNYCQIAPKNCVNSAGYLDNTMLAINAGRATVLERINYFLNTPEERIIKDLKQKL